MGGKCVGNVQLVYEKYYVRHAGRRIASVSVKDFSSLEKAFMHAKRLLRDYCAAENLLSNEYRLVTTEADRWLEVNTKNGTFTCDTDALGLVEDHNWKIHQETNIVHTVAPKYTTFPIALLSLPPYSKVHFLDHNPRNNRRSNLSHSKLTPADPIYISRGYWVVSAPLPDGSTLRFSIKKLGVVEARRLAWEAALRLPQSHTLLPKAEDTIAAPREVD